METYYLLVDLCRQTWILSWFWAKMRWFAIWFTFRPKTKNRIRRLIKKGSVYFELHYTGVGNPISMEEKKIRGRKVKNRSFNVSSFLFILFARCERRGWNSNGVVTFLGTEEKKNTNFRKRCKCFALLFFFFWQLWCLRLCRLRKKRKIRNSLRCVRKITKF